MVSSGGGTPGGANQQIQFNNAGTFGAVSNLSFNVASNTFTVGTGQFSSGVWNTQFNGNSNGFIQVGVWNSSNGTNSSSDFIVTGDIGTDSTSYLDLGWNNSLWSDPTFTIAGANSGYLYTANGPLAVGTANTLNDLILFAGGTLTGNEAARAFGANQNFSIKNTLLLGGKDLFAVVNAAYGQANSGSPANATNSLINSLIFG